MVVDRFGDRVLKGEGGLGLELQPVHLLPSVMHSFRVA